MPEMYVPAENAQALPDRGKIVRVFSRRGKKILIGVAVLLLGAMQGCGVNYGGNATEAWSSANAMNYAPASRTVLPVAIYATKGLVSNAAGVLRGDSTRLDGSGAGITLDFGKEVGGILTLRLAGASDSKQRVGIAFTESSLFVGPESDSSSGAARPDGAVYVNVTGAGSYTLPEDELRGGFRYVTIFLDSAGWVDLAGASLRFTPSPAMMNLRAYPNYFQSNDPLLNRIWYAGAYTVQMDTIGPGQGRAWPAPVSGWENDATLGDGASFLTDGAKRDRSLWPGDIGISQRTAFVSTGDTESVRNALNALYSEQSAEGGFPYCGPPINLGVVSDTYHLWTLVDSTEYYTETRDKEWLDNHWEQFKAGIRFAMGKIDGDGLFGITLTLDWGRPTWAGEELAANALLYHALDKGAYLARLENDESTAELYESAASNLKQAVNSILWDAGEGQYRDTPGSSLHPQDGNSLALWFGLTDSDAKASIVSRALRGNWNAYGARTPEKPGAIATFPGSMEVLGHFAANDDEAALELIRLEWGYMLNSPIGTNSTFWEGYLADGSFDYGGSYMSLAHGWATGPTSALTYYVLGIAPETAGLDYHVIPHPGDLTRVAGRLTLPGGAVEVLWKRESDSGTFTEKVRAPQSLSGRIGLPTFGNAVTVLIDGRIAWNGCKAVGQSAGQGPFTRASSDGRYVYFDGMRGSHTLVAEVGCE